MKDEDISKRLGLLSVVTVIAGFVAFLTFPLYYKKTYISENALLPDYAYTYFGMDDEVQYWKETLRQILSHQHQLETIGLDTCRRSESGGNIHAIVRAHRTDGTESMVVATEIDRENVQGLSAALAFARFYAQKKYLSRDLIFLFYQKGSKGVDSWLKEYHGNYTGESFKCYSGAIQMALILDCKSLPDSADFGSLKLEIVGRNGQLPNLDYVNIINKIGTGQGVNILFNRDTSGIVEKFVPEFLKSNQIFQSYLQEVYNLVAMILDLAFPKVDYVHSLFLQYRIDAVTLRYVQELKGSRVSKISFGRLVESTLRSLNNALEHLHQSFFFYLLPKSSHYISIGLYMPWLGLIASSYLLKGLSLFFKARAGDALFVENCIVTLGSMLLRYVSCSILGLAIIRWMSHENVLHWIPLWVGLTLFLTTISRLLPLGAADQKRSIESMIYLISVGLFLITLGVLNFSLASLIGVALLPTFLL